MSKWKRSRTLSEIHCPHSFCGFDFDDVKKWLADTPKCAPIVHNDQVIILQFSGWSVNLYADGSYAVEVTEGG
jgi:hypothetical protein